MAAPGGGKGEQEEVPEGVVKERAGVRAPREGLARAPTHGRRRSGDPAAGRRISCPSSPRGSSRRPWPAPGRGRSPSWDSRVGKGRLGRRPSWQHPRPEEQRDAHVGFFLGGSIFLFF